MSIKIISRRRSGRGSERENLMNAEFFFINERSIERSLKCLSRQNLSGKLQILAGSNLEV